MSEKHLRASEFSLGILLGLVAGTLIGLLMAPRSGAEIRGQISNRATDIKSAASVVVDQIRDGIEIAALQLERLVGLQERSLRHKLDRIKTQLDEYHLNEA